MDDRSLMDQIDLTLIALTVKAIHHCLLEWKPGQFRVPPEVGPGGGTRHKCNTTNIRHAVNDTCTNIFHCPDADFHSSSPEVWDKKIDNIRSMICRRIHSTVTERAMAQPHNDQGSFDEDFTDYVLEALIEKPDVRFNCLSSVVAATEASMRFAAALPVGGSSIANSSQPVPCSNSNSNSNSNDITSISNMITIENTGLIDGSTIVEGAMSLGG